MIGNLKVSAVGNLASFAGDVVCLPVMQNSDFEESSFFTSNRKIRTTKMLSEKNDRLILGISRLDQDIWGATSFNNKIICSFANYILNPAITELKLENCGLFDNMGNEMAVRPGSPAYLNVKAQSISISFENQQDTTSLFNEDTTSIIVTNAYNLQSVVGELDYDPNAIEVLDIIETTFFNNSNQINTSLMKVIDNQTGNMTFGISKLGEDFENKNTGSEPILDVIFRTKKMGNSAFSLSNTGLLSNNLNLKIPHFQKM